jgi:hypothetical protein
VFTDNRLAQTIVPFKDSRNSTGGYKVTSVDQGTTALSTTMQAAKKFDFAGLLDETCVEFKPTKHRKKTSVITNSEVDNLVKRLFKFEQERVKKIEIAKR